MPVAVVELREGEPATVDDLVAHASTRLARYELPAEVIIVDASPPHPLGEGGPAGRAGARAAGPDRR